MVKILHTADIHLDSPFSLLDVKKAQVRRNEMRGTFTSLMMYAKMEKFDMVILAGDVFDTEFATKETMELLVSQFAQNPECRFVISPGNHDPLTPKGAYSKVEFPPNVYIFNSDDVTKFSFDDIGVDVYGWAFLDAEKEENPLRRGAIELDPGKINILAVHADMTAADSTCCPMNERDIERSGFDYVALGHIHAGGEVKKAGNTYYAYSGCLEGRSFDECGPKGAIVCKIDTDGGKKEFSFGQKRFSIRRYEKAAIDVSDTKTEEDVIEKIKALMRKYSMGEDTLLRVRMFGTVSPKWKIDVSKITETELGVFYFELRDETQPLLDYEALMDDISIRGAFFRELLPKLKSEDPEERKIAAAALRYGLAALEGEDIGEF